MKRLMYLAVLISVTVIYGCKSDSDILATYKDSGITRGDFYKWLESKRYTKDSIIKSKAKQKDMLEKMAIELISVEKARQEGFDKKPEFQLVKDRISENMMMKKLYDKEIVKKASFKEPAAKVRQILLRVKDTEIDPKQKNKRVKLTGEKLNKIIEETMTKAKEIIGKLDKGESFEELAKQYSEDFTKKNGGDIGFVVSGLLPPDLSDVIFSLKKGEYTKEPVKTPRGVYIIKVEDTEEITEKNIDDIIENKSHASRMKSGMLRSYAKEYVDKLMNDKDVKYFENKILSKNTKDIIFTVGNKNYTVADLDKKLEARRPAGKVHKSKFKIKDSDKERMARNYFQFEVLKRNAVNKGIDKDPVFIKEVETHISPMLAREYFNDILEKDITVTDKELKEEYDKNKDKKYYSMVSKGKQRVKQVRPFKDVKDSIERSLAGRKRSEKKRNLERSLLAEYGLKIDESKLEGEK